MKFWAVMNEAPDGTLTLVGAFRMAASTETPTEERTLIYEVTLEGPGSEIVEIERKANP